MISEEKTRTAIFEYINRAKTIFLQGNLPHKNDAECRIDCPKCGYTQALECHSDRRTGVLWVCRWTSCNYKLPADIAPPSPEELASVFLYEEVLALKKRTDDLLNLGNLDSKSTQEH